MTIVLNGTTGITTPTTSTTGEFVTSVTGFKNRILNGGMVIDQRNAGASVTLTAIGFTYTLDRWNFYTSVTSKLTTQQNAGAVTPPSGFKNYLGATSSSAYSITSTDLFIVQQNIEGFNVADLGWGTASAQTITISFWVRSSLTGTFGGSIRNTNTSPNRAYPFTFTISVANTWEQKTITVAGDTSGTWGSTNSDGLILAFGLGVGSTYSGTAGAWNGTTNIFGATGATSVVGTSGATFYITGVQLEKGSTATSFDYRPYGTELALCQRYYFKYSVTGSDQSFGSGYNYGTTNFVFNTKFPVSMRTAPSALEQTGTAGDYKVIYLSSTATCTSVPTFSSASVNAADSFWTVAAVLTAGQGALPRSSNANAFHAWSAEL